MLRRSRAAFVGCTLIAVLARADAVATAQLPVERHELPNGVTLVLAPDRTVSSVVVQLRFAGGAAAETTEQAGYTRLVEGLFADGSVHIKAGEHARLIEEAGGWTTSQTTLDELVLTTQAAPGALDLVLWLEAERMAGLADAISEEHVANEREAMAAAYRAAYIEAPYALVPRSLRAALWPAASANRRDILGDPAAIAHATLASVRAFVRDRIRPERTTVVIAGNIEPSVVRERAGRYFGWIPGGTHLDEIAPRPVTAVAAGVRVTVRDPVAQIAIGYRLPAGETDRVAFALIARLVAGSSDSLLEPFVDAGRATDVHGEVEFHPGGGQLVVHITPSATLDRAGIEQLAGDARTAISSLHDVSPREAVLDDVRRGWIVERLLALETLAGRAAAYPEWRTHPSIDDHVRDLQLAARGLRPRDLSALAAAWLAPRSAVTVIGLPEGSAP